MKIPTEAEYLQYSKKLWNKCAGYGERMLKLCYGTTEIEKYLEIQKKVYKETYTKGEAHAKEAVKWGTDALKIALDRLEKSEEITQKAIKQSEDIHEIQEEQEFKNMIDKKVSGRNK